jgi:hypothetical protein
VKDFLLQPAPGLVAPGVPLIRSRVAPVQGSGNGRHLPEIGQQIPGGVFQMTTPLLDLSGIVGRRAVEPNPLNAGIVKTAEKGR